MWFWTIFSGFLLMVGTPVVALNLNPDLPIFWYGLAVTILGFVIALETTKDM